MGLFCTPEEVQQQWEDARRGIVPADPTVVLQIPSQNDPDLAPEGKHAASAFALWFPIEGDADYGQAKVEMGQRVIDKITRLAPNFERSIIRHTTFTPKHMGVMFGAPGGDYCHGLLNADQIGPNRPGPKGFLGQPIPIDRSVPGQRGMSWRAGDHVHPGLQRGPSGARRPLAALAQQLVQQGGELVRALGCEGGTQPVPRYVQGDQRRLEWPLDIQGQPTAEV